MPKRAVADDLAAALIQAKGRQSKAGRSLHDDVAPLLSAAGLRLQLLRMDFPVAAERASEVMQTLDDAMDRVRAVSQELISSPAYRTGFKNALAHLIDAQGGRIRFAYTSTAQIPAEIGAALYDATAAALGQALADSTATRIDVSVTGNRSVRVRVKDSGRARRDLAMTALLARHAGLKFDILARKGTIVTIEHALRRPSRG